MKVIATSYFICLFSLLICRGEDSSRITEINRQLLEKQRKADPYKNVVKPSPEMSARTSKDHPKLSERVSFLTDGQNTVIIPRGAVIHIPKDGKISIKDRINGRLVEWDEFYLSNRNSIRLQELNLKQLHGEDGIDQEIAQQIIDANLLTLTSFQNKVVALANPPNISKTQ